MRGEVRCAPSAAVSNLTGLLEKAGCKTFAGLLVSSGVLKTYESTIEKGLTVFAPNDEAFKDDDVPDLTKLVERLRIKCEPEGLEPLLDLVDVCSLLARADEDHAAIRRTLENDPLIEQRLVASGGIPGEASP